MRVHRRADGVSEILSTKAEWIQEIRQLIATVRQLLEDVERSRVGRIPSAFWRITAGEHHLTRCLTFLEGRRTVPAGFSEAFAAGRQAGLLEAWAFKVKTQRIIDNYAKSRRRGAAVGRRAGRGRTEDDLAKRKAFRVEAKRQWDREPSLSVSKMVSRLMVTIRFKDDPRKPATVRTWIKDLKPKSVL